MDDDSFPLSSKDIIIENEVDDPSLMDSEDLILNKGIGKTSSNDLEDNDKDANDPLTEEEKAHLNETQNSLLVKKIDNYVPILKFLLDRLKENKDQFCETVKSDLDKLSHLYYVFTEGDIKEKLDMFTSSEKFLEKLYNQYQLSKSKRKDLNTNIPSTSEAVDVNLPSSSTRLLPALPNPLNIVPTIHNVVCSVDMGCKLELLKIALATRNTEFNPRRFHAVVLRLDHPRTVTLIFSTGKLVTTGAKNEAAAHLASRKCARILQKLGNQVQFLNFKIQNMVATCNVRFPIHVDNLYKAHCQFCNYEPELFPGLIYRVFKPRVVLLIFVTGKFIITGAKDRKQLYEACAFICPILKSFRKH